MKVYSILLLLVLFGAQLYSCPSTIIFEKGIFFVETGDSLVDKTHPNSSFQDIFQVVQLSEPITSDSGKVNIVKIKLTTAVLAVCTGLLGGHRLYLGTKPIVPIVYAVTLGGGFGMLPLIDLIVILVSNDVNQYMNNPKILMWIPD